MAMTLRLSEQDEAMLTDLANSQGISKQEATVRAIREVAARQGQEQSVRALSQQGRERYADDGNKRLCWLATYVFYGLNGATLEAPDDAAYELVVATASGQVEVPAIAQVLAGWRGDEK